MSERGVKVSKMRQKKAKNKVVSEELNHKVSLKTIQLFHYLYFTYFIEFLFKFLLLWGFGVLGCRRRYSAVGVREWNRWGACWPHPLPAAAC